MQLCLVALRVFTEANAVFLISWPWALAANFGRVSLFSLACRTLCVAMRLKHPCWNISCRSTECFQREWHPKKGLSIEEILFCQSMAHLWQAQSTGMSWILFITQGCTNMQSLSSRRKKRKQTIPPDSRYQLLAENVWGLERMFPWK